MDLVWFGSSNRTIRLLYNLEESGIVFCEKKEEKKTSNEKKI